MKVFLFAGLLYLTGLAIILLIKPEVMFRKDGTWKEFGLGRNPNNYTWCPFWLFCIFWALVSYILSALLIKLFTGKPLATNSIGSPVSSSDLQALQEIDAGQRPKRIRRGNDLPEGYYVLSRPVRAGETPSYTYLGPEYEA